MRSKPAPGMYLFYSEDRKKMCLLADSDVPLDVKEFLFSISSWVDMAKRNSDAISDSMKEEDEDGSADEGMH